MNRKDFLKQSVGAFGLLSLSGMASIGEKRHVLYADGLHCDAKAIGAWFRGDPVYYKNGSRAGNIIENKKFLIEETIFLDHAKGEKVFTNNRLTIYRKNNNVGFYITSTTGNVAITHNYFEVK